MPSDSFNRLFDTRVPEGADGNQAHYGLFVRDREGRFMRITQAEGNEISYNPETETRSLIGNESPSETVRRYQIQISKGLLIRKGDREYEFFNRFRERLPTGANARLSMMLADFRQETPGKLPGRFNYRAFAFAVTATVNTANETDGVLDVSLGQASDVTRGIASSDGFEGTDAYPVFVPASDIPVEVMRVGKTSAALKPGGEAWIPVDFEPLGCDDSFEIVRSGSDAHDERVCLAAIRLDSVVITARAVGTTSVKVRSTADPSKSQTIAVTVTAGISGGSAGIGSADMASAPAAPAKGKE